MTKTFTISSYDDYAAAQTQIINEFGEQIMNAEVSNRVLGSGKIVSIANPCNDFESILVTVHFDLDETKAYGIAIALKTGNLKFADESLIDLWNSYFEVHTTLKSQLSKANTETRAREKEAQKLEQKRKSTEKKVASMRASAEKEINTLIENRERITAADDFYYALGWLANHAGTITAKMPDYLENAFVKHFGDVERTIVDSTKVGPAGYTSQWRLSMEASLKKAKEIPAVLNQYLNPNGNKISKTSFVWSLIDDYGFRLGKNQSIAEIIKHVPTEYHYFFNEGVTA